MRESRMTWTGIPTVNWKILAKLRRHVLLKCQLTVVYYQRRVKSLFEYTQVLKDFILQKVTAMKTETSK